MDWFTSLPPDMQRHIEEAAAGTSIEHSVILDKLLFEERGRWIGELNPSAWVNKIEEILINYREGLVTIQKFVLHIPEMQYKWGLYINSWLSFLSTNSIKEVSVDNWNVITYKLSSILFEWSELTRLKLRNCAFYKSFGCFQHLRFLHLEEIEFGSVKVGTVRFHAPLLVHSELVDCTGFQHFNIVAPRLENFVVASSDGMSHDDANQLRLKLGGKTIDDEGGRNCRSCGGCCRWGEPGYRVKYVFHPGNGRQQFVFSSEARARSCT